MALQISEGTRQSTLNILGDFARLPFPLGYARMESFNLNYNDPSFTAVMALYYDEDARNTSPQKCSYYAIGCTLQQADFDIIASIDDRQLLYKHVEYIIHFQQAQKDVTDENKATLQAELDALSDELGIQTLFRL